MRQNSNYIVGRVDTTRLISVCIHAHQLQNCHLVAVDCKLGNKLKSLFIEAKEPLIEDVMNKFIRGAPHLEFLNLRIAESDQNLNIQSTSLKMLKIDRFILKLKEDGAKDAILRISAPNLEILGVSHRRCLLNVSRLSNAILGFHDRDSFTKGCYSDNILVEEMLRRVFLSILHAEKVTLSAWCIKVLGDLKKKDKIVVFSNAKVLKFDANASDEILAVLEMFPKLMILSLQLEQSPFIHRRPCKATTSFPNPSLPHLKRVEITWHLCDT